MRNQFLMFRIHRTDLFSALTNGLKGTPESFRLGGYIGKDSIAIGFWQNEIDTYPRDFFWFEPDFILVENGSKREFLAWADTYVSDFAPLSQVYRVFEESELKEVAFADSGKKHGETIQKFSRPKMLAWTGAIIGECISQTGGADLRQILTLNACLSTYSYSAAKCKQIWPNTHSLNNLLDGIEKVRTMLQVGDRRIPPPHLLWVWKVIELIEGNERFLPSLNSTDTETKIISIIVSCCEEIYSKGSISASLLHHINDIVDSELDFASLEQMSSEERVKFVETFMMKNLNSSSSDELFGLTQFVLAYLSSKIGGGWRNIELVCGWTSDFPYSPIWFVMVFLLSEKNTFGPSFYGIPRFLLRDMDAQFRIEERPRADISLDELPVLINPNQADKILFRTAQSRAVSIEIYPGVTTLVPLERNIKATPVAAPVRDSATDFERLARRVETLEQEVSKLKGRRNAATSKEAGTTRRMKQNKLLD